MVWVNTGFSTLHQIIGFSNCWLGGSSTIVVWLCTNVTHDTRLPSRANVRPPLVCPLNEVAAHYASFYEINPLKQQDILDKEPRFKQRGLTDFNQRLFHLKSRFKLCVTEYLSKNTPVTPLILVYLLFVRSQIKVDRWI